MPRAGTVLPSARQKCYYRKGFGRGWASCPLTPKIGSPRVSHSDRRSSETNHCAARCCEDSAQWEFQPRCIPINSSRVWTAASSSPSPPASKSSMLKKGFRTSLVGARIAVRLARQARVAAAAAAALASTAAAAAAVSGRCSARPAAAAAARQKSRSNLAATSRSIAETASKTSGPRTNLRRLVDEIEAAAERRPLRLLRHRT
jgi:hypothetical protein